MSQTSLEKFAAELENNKEWADSLNELSPEEIIARASEKGFDFSTEDLGMVVNASGDELSDSELEHAAGGRSWYTSYSRFHSMTRRLRVSHLDNFCPVGKFNQF